MLPNRLKQIKELDFEMGKILDELKSIEIENNMILWIKKLVQYQLIGRFVRVVLSRHLKCGRDDKFEKFILKSEEKEYDQFRRNFLKKNYDNMSAKRILVQREDNFIEGTSLNVSELFVVFWME